MRAKIKARAKEIAAEQLAVLNKVALSSFYTEPPVGTLPAAEEALAKEMAEEAIRWHKKKHRRSVRRS